jgi:ankyrin repeat protein
MITKVIPQLPKVIPQLPKVIPQLPNEIKDRILMYIDTDTIRMIGKTYVSKYIWLKKGQSLEEAAKNGNLFRVNYIIVNKERKASEYYEALVLSAANGHIDIVKLLVENGADKHAHHDTVIMMCVSNGHLEIVKYLFKYWDQVNYDQALRISMSHVHTKINDFLIKHKKDIYTDASVAFRANVRRIQNNNRPHYGVANGHLDVVRYLVEHGTRI